MLKQPYKQNAAKRGLLVLVFIIDPPPPLRDEDQESDQARARLAALKKELARGVVRTVASVADFRTAVTSALAKTKERIEQRRRWAVIVAMASTVLVAIIVWQFVRPTVSSPPPPLPTFVSGTVTTRRGQAPGNGRISLTCEKSASAPIDPKGRYTISLTTVRGDCRSLPLELLVSTTDGRSKTELIADPSNGDIVIDDPPNTVTHATRVGFELQRIELEKPIRNGRIVMLQEFPSDQDATLPTPRLLIMSGGSDPRAGLLVSATAPPAGAIVSTTSAAAHPSELILGVRRGLQGGGVNGIHSLEQVLGALVSAGVDPRLLSQTYQEMAESWTGEDCSTRERALKWIQLASKTDPSRSLSSESADLLSRRTLACNRP